MARLADLRSRAVLRTADELGIPHAHAVGLRELLYATCFQKADPTIGDARDVELSAGWEGERGRFVAAARAAGMIVEQADGAFALPDFEDAAPSWVRKRAKRAAERDAVGKTVSELRREAGAKGAAARANKRDTSGNRLPTARDQTAPLPSLPPSFPPSSHDEELRSSSAREDGISTAPRPTPTRGTVAVYVSAWTLRYGRQPNPTKGDILAANRALESLAPSEREAVVRAFVEDDDPWLAQKAHRLGLLPKQLDRILAKLAGTLSPGRRESGRGVRDCTIPRDTPLDLEVLA